MSKVKVSSSYREITRIRIIRKIPKGIYTTKAQEALGKVVAKIDEWDLSSMEISSWSEESGSFHEYIIIFNRTFEYPGNVARDIADIFEDQDWGEIEKP